MSDPVGAAPKMPPKILAQVFSSATEAELRGGGGTRAERNQASRARAAAVAAAYEPLVGLKQLGGAGGGRVWVGEGGCSGCSY
jgi:hypothetical protein